MRNRQILVGLVLATALQACTFTSGTNSPPPAVPITGSPAALPVQPSTIPSTLQPAIVSLPSPTSILEVVRARPRQAPVNCRLGPGTVYIVIGELQEYQAEEVAGRSEDATWYYIHHPGNPGGFCWVAAEVVEIEGNPEALPVVPPPVASVTDIGLTLEPTRILITCDKFPQLVYMTAQITTDGPALVTYRWEASTGAASVDNTIPFAEAGTQTIQEYYPIGSPNEYWIRLHVLGPNEKTQQVNFNASCTP